MYAGILKLPLLIQTLKSSNGGNPHPTLQNVFTSVLEELVNDMSKYRELIETTLDLSLVDKGEFLIKAEFDEDLQGNIFTLNSFFTINILNF